MSATIIIDPGHDFFGAFSTGYRLVPWRRAAFDYWPPRPTSEAREQSSSASQFKFKWQVSNPVANDIQEDNMDIANLLIIIVTIFGSWRQRSVHSGTLVLGS